MSQAHRDSEVVLGLSCDFHDSAAAILVDGTVAAAAQEERFSRLKHDASVPELAVAACLAEAGLAADDVDHVVFYEKPLLVAARYLAGKQRQGFRGYRSFLHDGPRVFGSNLLIGYRIATMLQRLGADMPPQVQFVEHHLSHASAAFFASPHEQAAVLTIDGIGEWATATVGLGIRNRLELIEELRYPDSLGLIYSLITAHCGFRPNADEYKLMGLAPYGEPKYSDALREIAEPQSDGSLGVSGKSVSWFRPGATSSATLERLLDGPPRHPDDPLTQREADLATSVQLLTEEVVLGMAQHAHELTGESALCLAGGVALNCVANGKVLREGPFDELWIQPAAGDAGSAIGCALAYWHLELGRPRATTGQDKMAGSLLGPSISEPDARSAIEDLGLPFETPGEDVLLDQVAQRLAAGEVVGWCRGRMEFGPRALGNRSILADPRSTTVRQRINRDTKGRESFRPFAPAILAEHASQWFALDHHSNYMLLVAPVAEAHLLPTTNEPTDLAERAAIPRSTIPACTHVDGSARVQTVAEDANPMFRGLLERFHTLTGCPALLNTSFNRAEEPIVCTAAEAIRTAAACALDLLVVGPHLVEGADLRRLAAATGTDPVEQVPAHG